jgi:hypothetical protein
MSMREKHDSSPSAMEVSFPSGNSINSFKETAWAREDWRGPAEINSETMVNGTNQPYVPECVRRRAALKSVHRLVA